MGLPNSCTVEDFTGSRMFLWPSHKADMKWNCLFLEACFFYKTSVTFLFPSHVPYCLQFVHGSVNSLWQKFLGHKGFKAKAYRPSVTELFHDSKKGRCFSQLFWHNTFQCHSRGKFLFWILCGLLPLGMAYKLLAKTVHKCSVPASVMPSKLEHAPVGRAVPIL